MVRLLVKSGAAIFARTVSDNEIAEDKCTVEDDGLDSVYSYLAGANSPSLLPKMSI
jgi:hypothetical protein